MEMPAEMWHVYEFSCMYIEDLGRDFQDWLGRCNLKSQNTFIGHIDMTTITFLAVGDAIASLHEIIDYNSMSSSRRFAMESCFKATEIDVPVVLIAHEKDENMVGQLVFKKFKNSRRPIVIYLFENGQSQRTYNKILRGSEFARTSFVQKHNLVDCVNNLLERSAFDVVFDLMNTLQNVRRKIETLATIPAEEETEFILQRLEDYLVFLEKCGFEIITRGEKLTSESVKQQINLMIRYKDLLLTLQLKIARMYQLSKVPEFERPDFLDKIISSRCLDEQEQQDILNVENVVGIGNGFGKTCIFIDADIQEEHRRKTEFHLKSVLKKIGLKEYSLQLTTKEIQKCLTIGARIGREFFGTLGCFAWMKRPEKDYDLCAIVSGHVARCQGQYMLLGSNESSKAEILGEIIVPDDVRYDISAVITKADDRINFKNIHFKNEKGEYVSNCKLYNIEDPLPYLVFLWGIASKPGLGKIEINGFESQLFGKHLFLIRSRDEHFPVGKEGDSGAIICTRDRNNKQYAVGIFIGKFKKSDSTEPNAKDYSNCYIAQALQPGFQKLSDDHNCSITLHKPVS